MKRYLVLENGNVYEGTAMGDSKSVISEIVFTTAMIYAILSSSLTFIAFTINISAAKITISFRFYCV